MPWITFEPSLIIVVISFIFKAIDFLMWICLIYKKLVLKVFWKKMFLFYFFPDTLFFRLMPFYKLQTLGVVLEFLGIPKCKNLWVLTLNIINIQKHNSKRCWRKSFVNCLQSVDFFRFPCDNIFYLNRDIICSQDLWYANVVLYRSFAFYLLVMNMDVIYACN